MTTLRRGDPGLYGDEVAVIIPARFGSARLPGKPLVPLRGVDGTAKTLVERSWEVGCSVVGSGACWIATDDARIVEEAHRFGARTTLTSRLCRNGTERCREALDTAGIDAEIIVQLHGDAPLTPPLAIETLLALMRAEPDIRVATSMIRCGPITAAYLKSENRYGRSGGTTIVADSSAHALYFSKGLVPHAPHRQDVPLFLQMGLYAYRRGALVDYAQRKPGDLEEIEGLEQLRFVEAGIPIRVVELAKPPGGLWEIDRPEDIVIVERALAERRLS